MKILMVNKFLHPNGGSETYIFKLGEQLIKMGHEVQYFGMEHAGRCVGNHAEVYTSDMDFHGGSKLSKLTYPIKTIYSGEARKKMLVVLNDFAPDVVHLNNFNYQLTPSVILAVKDYEKKTGRKVRIVFTAHDYQLVCPNHMCNNPNSHENCEKCLKGSFMNCTKDKCIHGSTAKSFIGTLEATYWNNKRVYDRIDTIICCSEFMKSKMDSNPRFASKTIAIHNFIDEIAWEEVEKEDYVLYFGRYSEEKGIRTIIEAAKKMPKVKFIFAGKGPLENLLDGIENISNVGFKSGKELSDLIRKAKVSIYPSEWYENCPFSVMESQLYGTPVIGADIGGIPELIQVGKTGLLFEAGNIDMLCEAIGKIYFDNDTASMMHEACKNISFDTIDKYIVKLLGIYGGGE